MAVLTSLSNLVNVLQTLDSASCPHAWLDANAGMLLGTFPTPLFNYDFAEEKLRPLSSSLPRTKSKTSLVHLAQRDGGRHYEIETDESIYELASARQALCWGLEYIEQKAPGTLDKFSARKGRSKRPVASSRADLYDLPSQRQYAEQISTGHFVATNNKAAESLGFLRKAAEIANLSKEQFTVRQLGR